MRSSSGAASSVSYSASSAMTRSTRIERLLTFESRLLIWADAIAPGLVDRFFARALAREDDD